MASLSLFLAGSCPLTRRLPDSRLQVTIPGVTRPTSISIGGSFNAGRRGRQPLQVYGFELFKKIFPGLKKPEFLPDFGKETRKDLLDKFYSNLDSDTYKEVLAEDVKIVEGGPDSQETRTFGKAEWERLMLECVKLAVPDFKWGHATDGTKDKDGYCIVTVKATGHHTGQPFFLPGSTLPPVAPTGKRFAMDQEIMKVKVEEGKITELSVLPVKNAGPMALYCALSGKTMDEVNSSASFESVDA